MNKQNKFISSQIVSRKPTLTQRIGGDICYHGDKYYGTKRTNSITLSPECASQASVKRTTSQALRASPRQIKSGQLPLFLPQNLPLLPIPPKLNLQIKCLPPKSPLSSTPCTAMSPSVCPSYHLHRDLYSLSPTHSRRGREGWHRECRRDSGNIPVCAFILVQSLSS
jgi:hypothetical protein